MVTIEEIDVRIKKNKQIIRDANKELKEKEFKLDKLVNVKYKTSNERENIVELEKEINQLNINVNTAKIKIDDLILQRKNLVLQQAQEEAEKRAA